MDILLPHLVEIRIQKMVHRVFPRSLARGLTLDLLERPENELWDEIPLHAPPFGMTCVPQVLPIPLLEVKLDGLSLILLSSIKSIVVLRPRCVRKFKGVVLDASQTI